MLSGAPDANISIYNKEIAINSGDDCLLLVDNLNNQLVIKDCDLNIQSTLVNALDMGGN